MLPWVGVGLCFAGAGLFLVGVVHLCRSAPKVTHQAQEDANLR